MHTYIHTYMSIQEPALDLQQHLPEGPMAERLYFQILT
jgi:hypothetical protein